MKNLAFATVVFLLVTSGAETRAQETGAGKITQAESLESDGQEARKRGLPVVVFISQHGCQYCAALRRNVLHPMIRTGDSEKRMILREVSLDAGFELVDFAGAATTGREFAGRYGATITPTLLFLDAAGEELAERRVGIGNIEYYTHYLDRSLASATAAIDAAN